MPLDFSEMCKRPADALRGSLSILTTHECARVQRHCGAILKVDLEALRQVLGVKRNICENQQKSVCIACGKAVGDIVITY